MGSTTNYNEGTITLVSAEGFEFVMPKKAAMGSKMIKEMLETGDGPFGSMDRIPFPDIATPVLELICRFLNEKAKSGGRITSFKPLQQMDPTKEEDRQTVIELLLAANYLDV
eukprot:GEZU01015207.1.p1 GENE.GEZU01015207.1~~GEZU01015207.1.p1  ORF type:complete len:112 (+),score=17.54 GEZU01015207.1:171-506(+)